MIDKIFVQIAKTFGKSVVKSGSETAVNAIANEAVKSAVRSGAHKKAISDGLRLGSSEAAKIMAKWRWK
jgi:hypothetical protein